MHEMSIALSIVEIAEAEVKKAQAQKVDRIDLEIGTLAGIEWDALEFAWEPVVKGSVLARAEKHIEKIPGRAHCPACELEFAVADQFDPCPKCGSYFNELRRGKELRVKSMLVS